MADHSRLRKEVRSMEAELRDLLNTWDPLGLFAGDPRAPLDEYDCLHNVIGKLHQGASEADISAFLADELTNHFGIDPGSGQPEAFAATLYAWYWTDPLSGSIRRQS